LGLGALHLLHSMRRAKLVLPQSPFVHCQSLSPGATPAPAEAVVVVVAGAEAAAEEAALGGFTASHSSTEPLR
jgi:hypothetical protein